MLPSDRLEDMTFDELVEVYEEHLGGVVRPDDTEGTLRTRIGQLVSFVKE